MNRENIMVALLRQVAQAAPFLTRGRRVLPWSQVNAQPAIFVRHVGDNYAQRLKNTPAVATVKAEIWIYTKAGADPAVAPDSALNDLLDAVEALLQPTPTDGTGALTLGGLVTHCWIEGEVITDPGDLDGQAKAVIPVNMLVPT